MRPQSFLVVFASGKDRRIPGANLHASFQLKSAGERIQLTQPDGLVRDLVEVGQLREDISFGRHPNGQGSWKYFANPTPRRSNTAQQPYDSVVFEVPRFSHPAGFHPEPFALSLHSSESNVTLHYTLDGAEPTEDSPVYVDPLEVRSRVGEPNTLSLIQGTATANQHTDGWKAPLGEVRKVMVVRAWGIRPGALAGPVVTQTFLVSTNSVRTNGLPTLSLTTTPEGFFDYHTGIYMLGEIFDQYVNAHPGEALTGHTPANYTQRGSTWEREAHLEWFEPSGELAFTEPVLVDIQGQSSRSFRQKSLGLKARGVESPRKSFAYPIFPGLERLGGGGPLTEFRSLRLRNMGNDWEYAMMRDDWCHRLAGGLGLALMASRYVSLFLDGEYWGVLAAREQQDPDYLEAHFGFDENEVVILSGEGGLEEGQPGDEQPWLDLLKYCESHNLSIPANYEFVATRIDPQDALRYYLSEIYFGNADWPQNNMRVWRRRIGEPDAPLGPGRDGRWRWFLFDLDLAAGHPWSAGVGDKTLEAALSPQGRPGFNSPWGTAVFRALMTNPAWKRDFINNAADLLNSWYSPTRAAGLVDTMRIELKPAMDEHIRRWRANGGSVAAWELRVRTLRDFALQRTTVVRQHLQSRLGLAATSRLTVEVTPPEGGHVRVNSLLVDENLPGAPNPPNPWTGTYFNGIPVRLEALPKSGWQFDRWSGVPSDGRTTSVSLAASRTITARFVAAPALIRELQLDNDGLRLIVFGTPGARYEIQSSNNLDSWSEVGEAICGEDGRAEVKIHVGVVEGQGFLRVASK